MAPRRADARGQSASCAVAANGNGAVGRRGSMERYRDIIPNWETKEVIRQPLPATFRANPLRIDPDELERRLRRRP